MKESYLFDMTFNNIVFEGRNKAYGAYKLRRVYHRHITIATIVAVAIFSGGLIGPMVNNMLAGEPEKYVKPTYTITEPVTIYLPPPPVMPEPKQEKAPVVPATPKKVEVATAVYAKTKVVRDELVTKEVELANQDELANVNFGTTKVEGEAPTIANLDVPKDALTGIDTGGGTTETQVFFSADEMPAYNGGMEALVKYLNRNIRYPNQALVAEVEGTVVVTFVVDRKGEIGHVEVLKGLGFGTDEEAIRVVTKMPRWEPGKQNGKPVAVRYTLPIKFSLKK